MTLIKDTSLTVFPQNLSGMKNFRLEREICDPLYKYIYVTKMENDIIDSREFQRLDRLFQTPSAHFVYPNATHTRKSHSLGVMYLANLALQRLLYRQSSILRKKIPHLLTNQFVLGDIRELDNFNDSDLWDGKSFLEILETVRIAALCHDIGHGPFSHIFENVCNSLYEERKCKEFDHENMSAKIIQERLKNKIKDPIKIDDIVDILLGHIEKLKFLTKIIDGPYDVDKLDYVNRDAYHTGAFEYGAIDYVRIIDGFRVKDSELLISSSALESVMNSFSATQFMYKCVYYHKTARIFDFMLFEAMRMIPDFLNELLNDLDKFIDTDDHNFISKIKERIGKSDKNNNYAAAYDLLKDFMDRKKIYKHIYQRHITFDPRARIDEDFKNLRKKLEEEYNDLKTKIDYSTEVRPIRIDVKSFYDWMRGKRIWDELSHENRNLEDVSKAYFDMLSRSHIIFGIYIDREIFLDEKSLNRRNQLISEAEARLDEIQRF